MMEPSRAQLLAFIFAIWATFCVCVSKKKKIVTLDGIEKGNSIQCSITQWGKDGFGHQYEAKLSCMALAVLMPNRFKYIHTPFERFEHISTTPRILNDYVNLEKETYVQIADALGSLGMKRSSKLLESELLAKWIHMAAYSEKGVCDEKVVYVIDNCWDIVYSAAYASQTTDVINRGAFRRTFLSTSKPDTGFDLSRPNVVIHIRRGDAGERIQDEGYFEKAIAFYNRTLRKSTPSGSTKTPLFWVESDEPSWAPIKSWHSKYPTDFRLPNEKEDLMKIFNRLVMADGIVMSYSSISHAAVYLNAAKALLTVSGSQCFSIDPDMLGIAIRKHWYSTNRFLIINATASVESLVSKTRVVELSPIGAASSTTRDSLGGGSTNRLDVPDVPSSPSDVATGSSSTSTSKSKSTKNDPRKSSNRAANKIEKRVDGSQPNAKNTVGNPKNSLIIDSQAAALAKAQGVARTVSISASSDVQKSSLSADFIEKFKLSKGTTTKCLLTQFGTDGFGHQFEGKLSCILLSYLMPERFAYLHTHSRRFTHSTVSVEDLNDFTNLAAGDYPMADKAIKKIDKGLREGPLLRAHELNQWIRNATDQPTNHCGKDVVYVVDNCWAVTYREPQASMIVKSEYRDKIRAIYFGTTKPDTGFDQSRPNVVIHIRRGDAGFRIQGEAYYNAAIAYYNRTFGSGKYRVQGTTYPYPLFWIESDDVRWKPIERWRRNHPNAFRLPRTGDNLKISFHRMVMADGLIMSYSSVSNAAALLNNATAPLLVPGSLLYNEANSSSLAQIILRRPWLETERFLIINSTR